MGVKVVPRWPQDHPKLQKGVQNGVQKGVKKRQKSIKFWLKKTKMSRSLRDIDSYAKINMPVQLPSGELHSFTLDVNATVNDLLLLV